jgi:hypothetical protein
VPRSVLGVFVAGLLLLVSSSAAASPVELQAAGPTPAIAGPASATALAVRWPIPGPPNAAFPIRATFYYPWSPGAWDQLGTDPYTRFHPSAGRYDSADPTVIAAHLADMEWAHIDAALSSWWGQGTWTDARLEQLVNLSAGRSVTWAPYVESEGYGNPSVADIDSDIDSFVSRFASRSEVLHIDGKMVVFVYGQGSDDCAMAQRWTDANHGRVYLVLKVVSGFRSCVAQPDAWHQYGPAEATSTILPWSFAVSPGFWKPGKSVRLTRNEARWRQDVVAMVASNALFQLVTTFNEWGEGTAVESASEWATPSGHGLYLDVLHELP